MIYVEDNFLDYKVFKDLQEYCESNTFGLVKAGDKSFSVLETPSNVLDILKRNIGGHEISLSFIRRAYKGFDNDMRIHCDGIIANQKTSYASVLYINQDEGVTPNGTAFYSHVEHGDYLDKDSSEDEFNRLILEDSNDDSKWEMTSMVKSKQNRLLTYDANYFHAKFPKEIESGERVVLVCFYTKE